MKTLKFTCILFSIVLFIACNNTIDNDDNNKNEININVCQGSNPAWILDRINTILEQTTHFRPVSVYSIVENSTQYIAIEDAVNSSKADGLMFFLCSGEQIEFSSALYEKLYKLYVEKESVLLWSN